MFLSSVCESLDQGCVSFEGMWAVGSALPRPLPEPHDPIYRPPLGHVRHSLYTQIIRIPCMHPTVHLICGHSWATVGLHAGETVCFGESVTKTFHFSNSIRSTSCTKWTISFEVFGPWYFKRDCPICTQSASSFCRNPLNFLAHAMWLKWWYRAKFQPLQSSFVVLFNFRVI